MWEKFSPSVHDLQDISTVSFMGVSVMMWDINRKRNGCIIFLQSLRRVFCIDQWCQVKARGPRLWRPVGDVPPLVTRHRWRLIRWSAHERTFFFFLLFFLLRSVWFPIEHILANQMQRFSNRLGRALQAGTVCVCVCMRVFKKGRWNKGDGGRVEKVKREREQERWRNDRGDL